MQERVGGQGGPGDRELSCELMITFGLEGAIEESKAIFHRSDI